MRKKIIRYSYGSLIFASILVGSLATFLADTFKTITEGYEERFLEKLGREPYLYIIFPALGLTLIYFLRKYAFDNKENKGIKEIYNTLEHRKDELPNYKVISHYINGFLTVIFGGSTGIEVSTVVATATLGSTTHRRASIATKYKAEMIAAGVAAGITGLFGSPLAGIFFALEVIIRRFSKTLLLSTGTAAATSWIMLQFIDDKKLFNFQATHWNYSAMPYIIGMSIVAGLLSIYFTKIVLWTKKRFGKINNVYLRIGLGAAIIGIALFFFPELYGDSYHSVKNMYQRSLSGSFSVPLALLLGTLILLKPLIAAITLGAGGDGGVFAPSMVTGAMLGVLIAMGCNYYLGTNLIVINFIIVGMGALLSGSIHAPFTGIALAYTISGSPILLVPIIIGAAIAMLTARLLYKYNVYTYRATPAVVKKAA